MTTTALKLNLGEGSITLPDGSKSDVVREFSLMTATIDQSDVDAELEVLAEKALVASQKLKAAELASKSASDALKKALEKAGKLNADTKQVGPVRTTIFPTRRFDETLARSLMSKRLQKECEKTVLDSSLVKAKVAPEVYEEFQKVSGYTLKVDVAE